MNMHAPALSFMRDPQPAAGSITAVREEALQALADLPEALPLTAWRGRSGRRYVVSILDAREPLPVDDGGVVLAVVRNDHDGAVVLGSIGLPERNCGKGACVPFPARSRKSESAPAAEDARNIWCDVMRARGACEWHLHLLARTPLAQEAMRADLTCLPRTTA